LSNIWDSFIKGTKIQIGGIIYMGNHKNFGTNLELDYQNHMYNNIFYDLIFHSLTTTSQSPMGRLVKKKKNLSRNLNIWLGNLDSSLPFQVAKKLPLALFVIMSFIPLKIDP
jgi:hypothetical protein